MNTEAVAEPENVAAALRRIVASGERALFLRPDYMLAALPPGSSDSFNPPLYEQLTAPALSAWNAKPADAAGCTCIMGHDDMLRLVPLAVALMQGQLGTGLEHALSCSLACDGLTLLSMCCGPMAAFSIDISSAHVAVHCTAAPSPLPWKETPGFVALASAPRSYLAEVLGCDIAAWLSDLGSQGLVDNAVRFQTFTSFHSRVRRLISVSSDIPQVYRAMAARIISEELQLVARDGGLVPMSARDFEALKHLAALLQLAEGDLLKGLATFHDPVHRSIHRIANVPRDLHAFLAKWLSASLSRALEQLLRYSGPNIVILCVSGTPLAGPLLLEQLLGNLAMDRVTEWAAGILLPHPLSSDIDCGRMLSDAGASAKLLARDCAGLLALLSGWKDPRPAQRAADRTPAALVVTHAFGRASYVTPSTATVILGDWRAAAERLREAMEPALQQKHALFIDAFSVAPVGRRQQPPPAQHGGEFTLATAVLRGIVSPRHVIQIPFEHFCATLFPCLADAPLLCSLRASGRYKDLSDQDFVRLLCDVGGIPPSACALGDECVSLTAVGWQHVKRVTDAHEAREKRKQTLSTEQPPGQLIEARPSAPPNGVDGQRQLPAAAAAAAAVFPTSAHGPSLDAGHRSGGHTIAASSTTPGRQVAHPDPRRHPPAAYHAAGAENSCALSPSSSPSVRLNNAARQRILHRQTVGTCHTRVSLAPLKDETNATFSEWQTMIRQMK